MMRTEEEIRAKRDKMVIQNGGHFGMNVLVLDWVLREDPRSLEEANKLPLGTITNSVKQEQYMDKYRGKSWKEIAKELGPKEAKKIWEKLKNEKTGNDNKETKNKPKG